MPQPDNLAMSFRLCLLGSNVTLCREHAFEELLSTEDSDRFSDKDWNDNGRNTNRDREAGKDRL